jgi:hypothetical protein
MLSIISPTYRFESIDDRTVAFTLYTIRIRLQCALCQIAPLSHSSCMINGARRVFFAGPEIAAGIIARPLPRHFKRPKSDSRISNNVSFPTPFELYNIVFSTFLELARRLPYMIRAARQQFSLTRGPASP